MRYNKDKEQEDLMSELELDMLDDCEALDNIVYKFYNSSGKLLYVGITNNFATRYNHHKVNKEWIEEVGKVYVSEPMTRNEAHIYEIYYISLEKPMYNDHFSKGEIRRMELEELKFMLYAVL